MPQGAHGHVADHCREEYQIEPLGVDVHRLGNAQASYALPAYAEVR